MWVLQAVFFAIVGELAFEGLWHIRETNLLAGNIMFGAALISGIILGAAFINKKEGNK